MIFTDPFFWGYFIYFCFAIILAFYIPGNFFVRKINLTLFQNIVLSTIFGMVLWSLQGFFLGMLHLRFLTYGYLLVFFVLWIKNVHFHTKWKMPKFDFISTIIITVGTCILFSSVGFNGLTINKALTFCCNIPDSLYHIAVVQALVTTMPPVEPGMSGVIVKNYHYLSNLTVAELIRIFHLPLLYTQNQFMTLFISLFIGLSAIVFAQIHQVKASYTRWLLFFLYFYGDFIFLISFLLGNGLNFAYTMQENAATMWVSPPRVYAIVILFAGFTFLHLWIQKRSYFIGILMAITFGCLIGFKVYLGIFALSGMVFLGLYLLWKKEMKMASLLVAAGLISLAIYLPVNSQSGGLFFVGFWRFEDFIVNPSFNLARLELARRVYLEHHNFLRVASYELLYILLYIPSIFGIYLLGFFQTKPSLKLFSLESHIFFLSGVSISFLLGVFFFQQIGGANSSQFLFALYIVGAIYTALFCSFFTTKGSYPLKYLFILVILSLTVVRPFYTLYSNYMYLRHTIPVSANKNELEAIQYINMDTPASSVIMLGDKKMVLANTSYYVSFLIHKPIFLLGTGILNDHGVDTKKRMVATEVILDNKNAKMVGKTLLENNISYIYMPSNTRIVSTKSATFLPSVFHNNEITIRKVDKEKIQSFLQK